jgi:hypothetical protein
VGENVAQWYWVPALTTEKREKPNKLLYIRGHYLENEKSATEWEKMFVNYVSNKEFNMYNA